MGHTMEIERRVSVPNLTRAERRSWLLHRAVARRLDPQTLADWGPTIRRNLDVLSQGVAGEPHLTHLQRWTQIIESGDVPSLRRVLTGLDRASIEMREVSPLSGVLPEEVRLEVLAEAR